MIEAIVVFAAGFACRHYWPWVYAKFNEWLAKE